jgi:predicted nucleotidyltransferase/DNA-binding HxlR family transcriptional regulator
MSEYTIPLPGRSGIRRRILVLLLDTPGERLHLREIARRVGTSAGTAARELRRLQEAGLVHRRTEGRQAYFAAATGRAAPPSVDAAAATGIREAAAPYRAAAPDPVGLAVARRLRRELQEAFGRRLVDVYLFGSRARGDNRGDSDVDILVVLDEIGSYADDLRRTGGATAALSLESGVSISRLLATAASWESRDRPILRTIAVEGVRA